MKRSVLIPFAVLLVSISLVGQEKYPAKAPIVENWAAAWNSHDVQRVVSLFTDDVTYEDVTFGAVNHGSEELRKFAAFFFEAVPDMKFEVLNYSLQGNGGTIEWSFTGTDKNVYKTGKKFTVRGVTVIAVDHGKISRNLDFYDAATIMRQVGLLPSTDATSK